MKGQAWRQELRDLLIILALSGVVGLTIGHVAWCMVVGLLGHGLWIIAQVRRVDQWLLSSSDEIPESYGVWGDLLDKIYRLQKRERSAQDHLKATIRRVQESVDALEDGVILVNKKSNLEWCNCAARRMIGIQMGRDLGQPIFNLVRDPCFRAYFNARNYDEPLSFTMPNRPDQLLMLYFTEFGHNDRMIIVRDVTHISKLERMRSDFVANVSHELKTPITVLRGYLEQMVDCSDQLPQQWHGPIAQMNGQALRMNALVNDLLTLSRLESENSPKDQILLDVGELIEQVKSDVLQVHDREITIEAAEVGLLGSATEIRSALTNLVVNALKYTPENKPIRIRWRASSDGSSMDLQVRDRGEGIAPEHLSRLTERFYRVDKGRSSATGGTGLGLAIVKHIMLRHDGRLIIDSELGRGSRFTCRFPLFRLRPLEKEQIEQAGEFSSPCSGYPSSNREVGREIN